MIHHKGTVSRVDDDLLAALTAWAAEVRPNDRFEDVVFHVELTFGDVQRRFDRLPADTELPALTYVYAGTLSVEEAISTGFAGGLTRHQYELVVHSKDRRGMDAGAFELADVLVGNLREQGFRVTFQPEGRSRDEGEYTVGVFAEKE